MAKDTSNNLLTVHAVNQQPVHTKEEIESRLATLASTRDEQLFIGYSHPVSFVARGFEQQKAKNTNTLVNDWLTGIDAALQAQKQNRRQVRLVCLEEQAEVDSAAEIDDRYLLIAQEAIKQNSQASNLLCQLEPLTQTQGEQFYQPGIDINNVLKSLALASDASTELTAQKEENELLLLQLQQVQEELEQTFLKNKNMEKERDKASNEALDSSKKLAQQESELTLLKQKSEQDATKQTEIEEENELLLLQLQQVQEELESYFIKYKDGQKSLSTTKKDNDKLLKQLMKTQEQLEKETKKQPQKAQSKEITTLNRDLLNYQQRLLQLENKNSDLEQHNSELKTQLKNAEQQADITINQVPAVVDASAEKVINQRRTSLSRRVLRKLKLSKQKPSKKQQWLEETIERIAKSSYFDANWYLTEYPDLAEAGVNPAEHYLRFGGFESRNPSPKFDSDYYIAQNNDVKDEGINPLVHFLLFGEEEGRLPHPDSETQEGADA